MNLEDVVGIRCDRIAKGAFSNERMVYIKKIPYIVNCCNILFDRQDETHYVKFVKIKECDGRLIVEINANYGYECFVVNEENLVTRYFIC